MYRNIFSSWGDIIFSKQDQALPQKLIQSKEFATVNCLGIDQEAGTIYFNILLLFRNVVFKKICELDAKFQIRWSTIWNSRLLRILFMAL